MTPDLFNNTGERSVENLLASLINEALQQEASDIHFEPGELEGRVRFRIDGLLETVYIYSQEKISSLSARLKLLTGLDITERQKIQEGLLQWSAPKEEVEFRVSLMPTVRGEKIVLRRLVGEKNLLKLGQLGFNDENLQCLKELIYKNQGLIFLCGPTGSGKTTTTFACLKEIEDENINIITLEDPVEIYLEKINQIQVKTDAGDLFADKLRAGLRQDPDVIMVGEIRDVQTARMAVRAALTGHLVLTTIHTLDGLGAITRLKEMGIPAYLIAETLLGAIAQRLLRKTCSNCQGKGCHYCRQSGYKGRTALQEVILIDEDLKNPLLNGASRKKLLEICQEKNIKTLFDDGLEKVEKGITDEKEVRRVLK